MGRIGYARVSTRGQHTDGQAERLRAAGCEHVYVEDPVSGRLARRPQWDQCLAHLRRGDILMFTKLDRIGRSVQHLLDVVKLLGDKGVDLVALDQPGIDTTTPLGKLLFTIVAAVAEFEADLIRERTIDGLAAARERRGGKLPTRGPSLSDDQLRLMRELMANRETSGMSVKRIADLLGVHPATVYRNLDP